jgi:hypothetical protein
MCSPPQIVPSCDARSAADASPNGCTEQAGMGWADAAQANAQPDIQAANVGMR